MKLRLSVTILSVAIGLASQVHSRGTQAWTYQELQNMADLVVVAHPNEVENLDEKLVLSGISRMPVLNGDTRYYVLGVKTRFEVLAVLKGPKLESFVLFHYRRADTGPDINGPSLMSFDPKACERYLLFLRERSDGQYEPVAGQADLIVSIKQVGCL